MRLNFTFTRQLSQSNPSNKRGLRRQNESCFGPILLKPFCSSPTAVSFVTGVIVTKENEKS